MSLLFIHLKICFKVLLHIGSLRKGSAADFLSVAVESLILTAIN